LAKVNKLIETTEDENKKRSLNTRKERNIQALEELQAKLMRYEN
jgi:hypothetical protein